LPSHMPRWQSSDGEVLGAWSRTHVRQMLEGSHGCWTYRQEAQGERSAMVAGSRFGEEGCAVIILPRAQAAATWMFGRRYPKAFASCCPWAPTGQALSRYNSATPQLNSTE